MTAKRLSIVLGGLLLAAVLVIGLIQLAGRSGERSAASTAAPPLTATQIQARLAGSPPALASLHAQSDRLLPGGTRALHARLAALRGRPVVINKWASWCAPCRSEFSAFQRASVDRGREVAFIGIDSLDTSQSDAAAFLAKHAVSYPSYYDHSGALGTSITDTSFMPATVFYNRAGSRYIHQGPYGSLAKLEQDVQRYALR
jgi:cytochrome c biogenesis protein CcmG, thiol:disulfide interchange protein DsbE